MNRLPNIRFSKERDSDLIKWVESISSLPNGLKGEAVKDVLRMGLNKSKMPSEAPKVEPRTTKARPTAQLDISTLIEALRNEFLADIRTIVDASISQSLSGVTIGKEETPPAENNASRSSVRTEAEDILDSFADLMLE